jgi:trans-aconitate 2-methyltransferase
MGHATWDPHQYLAFSDHRLRPALELLARVPLERPRRVADLGCGMGDITAYLRSRWPAADLTGVDSSPEMLAQVEPPPASRRRRPTSGRTTRRRG